MRRLAKPSLGPLFVVTAPVVSLLVFYIIPAYLLSAAVDDKALPFVNYFMLPKALEFSVTVLLTYLFLILISYLIHSRPFRQTIRLSDIVSARKSFASRHRSLLNNASIFMSIIALLLLFPAMGSWENIWNTAGRFAVDSSATLTLQKLLATGAIIATLLTPRANLVTLGLAIVASGSYSFLISSRSVLLPFLLISVSALERRSLLSIILSVSLAAFFYFEALYDRQSVGLSRAFDLDHWVKVIDFIQSGIALGVWQSMWGVQTLSVAMAIKGSLTTLSWWHFLVYMSPIPSSVMDMSIYYPYQSLSYHLGITNLGLNSDALGESYLWFGNAGAFVLGTMYWAMVMIVLNIKQKTFRTLLFLGLIMFLAAGSVASLRASTRMYLLVLVAYLAFLSLRTISKRLKN